MLLRDVQARQAAQIQTNQTSSAERPVQAVYSGPGSSNSGSSVATPSFGSGTQSSPTSVIGRGGLNNVAAIGQMAALGVTSGTRLSGPGAGIYFASMIGGASPGNALAGIMARPDPMMNYLWYAEMPPLLVDGQTYSLPWYYVEEATTPFRQFEPRQVYREGRYKSFAGKYSLDSMSLGVYLDLEGRALHYFRAWHDLIVKPFVPEQQPLNAGGYRMPASYHQTIQIYLLDLLKQTIIQLVYTECWPSNIDSLGLQSGSSERLIHRVTINVGDVFIDTRQLTSNQVDMAVDKMQGPVTSEAPPVMSETAQTFPVDVGSPKIVEAPAAAP